VPPPIGGNGGGDANAVAANIKGASNATAKDAVHRRGADDLITDNRNNRMAFMVSVAYGG
jgi:hypothetical protein